MNSNAEQVTGYYHRTESRLGYQLVLHGTKHFGWYRPGQSMWQFSATMRRMEDELGRRLNLPTGSRVLDAGCGMGDVARRMASKFRLDVTGIDVLDFNVEEARRRSTDWDGLGPMGMGSARMGVGRTQFQVGDYHRLDFPDASYDGLYTMETFVHSADPEHVLDEFFRVLRPGGRLVMFEYSRTPGELLSPAAREALRQVCDLAAMPAWHRLHHGDLDRLVGAAGFGVESVTDVTERMLPMLHAFAILGAVPYRLGRALGRTENVVNALSGVEMWRHRDAWRYGIVVATKPA